MADIIMQRDPMGVSAEHFFFKKKAGNEMKDEGADFTKRGRIRWDRENERLPIYEEKVYY